MNKVIIVNVGFVFYKEIQFKKINTHSTREGGALAPSIDQPPLLVSLQII